MRLRTIILSLLLAFTVTTTAHADEPDVDDPIQTLVDRLGAANHADREEAVLRLREFGAASVPPLRIASKSDDPELQMRASALLAELEALVGVGEAVARQKAIAKELKIPVQKEIELGDGVKLSLVLIPADKFLMGSEERPGRTDPVHPVKIEKPYYIGKFSVTQKQYQEILGENPSSTKGDDLPVCNITHAKVLEFCQRASVRTGLKIRLPTEAEWEYACRAGTRTKYYSGDRDEDLAKAGWYGGNSGGKYHPVGRKQANAFGLHDMLGNVWELCEDDWHLGYKGAPADGSAWIDKPRGTSRSIRGGTFRLGSHNNTSAHRSSLVVKSTSSNYVGFRIVVSPVDRQAR